MLSAGLKTGRRIGLGVVAVLSTLGVATAGAAQASIPVVDGTAMSGGSYQTANTGFADPGDSSGTASWSATSDPGGQLSVSASASHPDQPVGYADAAADAEGSRTYTLAPGRYNAEAVINDVKVSGVTTGSGYVEGIFWLAISCAGCTFTIDYPDALVPQNTHVLAVSTEGSPMTGEQGSSFTADQTFTMRTPGTVTVAASLNESVGSSLRGCGAGTALLSLSGTVSSVQLFSNAASGVIPPEVPSAQLPVPLPLPSSPGTTC